MFDFLRGLVVDGFLPVFIALAEFMPTVVILLVVVSLFENSGFILGFGCTTLAVGAMNKNADTAYKRRMVRFLTFIPCSAKLPVLMFICGMILGWSAFGVVFLYLLSLALGLLFGGYYVVKVPKFRKVSFKALIIAIFKNILEFLNRISVGLLLAVAVLYTLQYFGFLVPVASVFTPLFVPIGLGSAAIISCLAFGLIAKEMIIGAILSFGVANLGLTTASAVSFIVFVLLYTSCLPSLTAIKHKLSLKDAFMAAFFNFAVAYAAAFVVYNVAVILAM